MIKQAKLFIAKDHNNKPIFIGKAESLEIFNAYLYGKGVIPNVVEDIQLDMPEDAIVQPILETESKNINIGLKSYEVIIIKE